MSKIRAIAIHKHSFAPAVTSAKNCLLWLGDFMYGTPERSRVTYVFAFALIVLGSLMGATESNGAMVCAN